MIFPIFNSIFFSFYTGEGLTPDHFVGLEDYIKLFTEYPYKDRLLNALINTSEYFIYTTLFINLGGFLIALLLTRKFPGSVFFRRLTYLPVIISTLVTGFIFKCRTKGAHRTL